MQQTETIKSSLSLAISQKIKDYGVLVKFKLNTIVVFSAAMGYLLGIGSFTSWTNFGMLYLGGFLITGASNALNQILEKDYDKLMKRTADRPMPSGRMKNTEAIILAGVMAIGGIFVLYQLNALTAVLGVIALFSYAFVYTPMKRISPIAVFIGAIPGALPPLIGWVAATGSIGWIGWILFTIQFMWQIPHFWAIAWVSDEDYKAAGFRLLPSKEGRDKTTALQTVFYTFLLMPIPLALYFMGLSGIWAASITLLCGIVYFIQSINLYNKVTVKAARMLMIGSFFYLPIVLLALVLDKL